MQIKNLCLKNFRNYDDLDISFQNGINIIYGENGQGKTNILEGIYMCGLGKSHKGSKEKEIIKRDKTEAHIKGSFEQTYGNFRVDIHLQREGGKGIAVNRVPIRKISELYGNLYMVIFSAEDLNIVKRGPAERRRFIDMELCQIDPIYVENLINYNKILVQRRELFKKMEEEEKNSPENNDMLDIWNMQLVNFGIKIIERRRRFIDELNKIIFDIHYELSTGQEKLKLVYNPSVTEDNFYEMLLLKRDYDQRHFQTSAGPHRDDFSFFDGHTDLKVYGSNGQQRTCALSLKLAEMKMIEDIKKEKPMLLLDDVLSELDRTRQRQLLRNIGNTQTIITCTGIDEFVEQELKNVKKFRINKAAVVNC